MGIQQIIGNKQPGIIESVQTLRTGQVVQGKILKLFPNNKAQIQLGSQQLIAQLEASLTIGANYHFQVKASNSLLHLQVIGHQLQSKDRLNTMNLLEQLGLKATKMNITFVQMLLSEKIPFDQEQLGGALQLLSKTGDKVEMQQIVKEMIRNKLPMTDSIFQALLTRQATSFTDGVNALLQQLMNSTNKTELQQHLMNRLSQIVDQPINGRTPFINQVITESSMNNPSLLNLLQAVGVMDRNVNLLQWTNNWEDFMKQNTSHSFQPENLPFQLNESSVMKRFEMIVENRTMFKMIASEMLHKWGSTIEQALAKNAPLPNNLFHQLSNEIIQKLLPMLSKEQNVAFQNNVQSISQILSQLQLLSSEQTFLKLEQLLTLENNPKQQFLSQLNQMLSTTGLNYEHSISNEISEKQLNTIKSMLIQLVQQPDVGSQEASNKLLHFINGMQLQSVHESNNFLQANLLIPAEKLGLGNDMQLEFEGKKTESGEINPDYCRILFYLELANLKDTVIDMNIQNRTVSITVVNDHEDISKQANALKPLLKKGLEELEYKLSTITFKSFQHMKDEPKRLANTQSQLSSYQGVDFRI
ncbi:hypothetical protein GMD78_16290 [Ornithinibacillus sp. L9]|uniref:Hook-length control protein FliK n=1 Tax=Ornithinibacillus caprae TaxID=2678566 RepID=A0A6N8FLA8_9BACI|nr:hypothetical protein [Ornithinibacillus caprae]MUK89931.1 hypothetical protein [Ornithinibacillus caprae]